MVGGWYGRWVDADAPEADTDAEPEGGETEDEMKDVEEEADNVRASGWVGGEERAGRATSCRLISEKQQAKEGREAETPGSSRTCADVGDEQTETSEKN